jgi:hypothetical protein
VLLPTQHEALKRTLRTQINRLHSKQSSPGSGTAGSTRTGQVARDKVDGAKRHIKAALF